MNPMDIFKIQNSWNQFKRNHPKFPLFIDAVSKEGISEDTIIEIKVTTADGKTYDSNLKLLASDIELINDLKNLS